MCMKHLVAADTVCSESLAAYIFKQSSLYISLDCIVNPDVVLCREFCHMIHCLAQQVHVVIVEGCRDLVELLYCAEI